MVLPDIEGTHVVSHSVLARSDTEWPFHAVACTPAGTVFVDVHEDGSVRVINRGGIHHIPAPQQ